MLGDEPYSTMCSMAMAGLQNVEHSQMVPQTGRPAAGAGRSGPCGDNDSVLMLRQMYLTSLAYQGLGQRTVPQVGSSFLEHPMDSEVLIDLGHTGLYSMGERTPPLPHQV